MSKYAIYCKEFELGMAEREALIERIDQISSSLTSIQRNLDMEIAQKDQIAQRLKLVNQDLLKRGNQIQSCVNTGNQILHLYQRTEERLIEHHVKSAEFISGAVSSVFENGAVTEDKKEESENADPSWKVFFDDLKDWISSLGKITDDDWLGFDSSVLGILVSLLEMGEKDNDLLESIIGLSKSLCSSVKSLATLTEKSKLKDCFGEMSTYLGTYLDLYRCAGKTIAEVFQDASGLIGDGVKLAELVYPLFEKDAENILKNLPGGKENYLASLSALFSMGTRAVGDVRAYSEDGVYDLNDYANTLLDVGVQGASSMLKAVTFGLLSVDAEEAVGVFQKNTEAYTKMVQELGVDTWQQVLLVVPGSAAVAVISAGEVIVNITTEMEDKLTDYTNSAVSWIKGLFR